MPSQREITRLIGFKSRNSALKLVNRLVKAGYLERDTTGRLLPKTALNEILFFRNYVEAGTGWISPAEEELRDTINLDQYLISNREATVMVPIQGDSMIKAGIMQGDTVLAERGAKYRDGTIVIARIDGRHVIKIFRQSGKKVWLESANPKYKPLFPKEELTVLATVIGLVRKY